MYRTFFGLVDNPFSINPDPHYLCSTGGAEESCVKLLHGVWRRLGFLLLTGEVGTGKTTLLNKLLDQFRIDKIASAFVFNPRLNTMQFLDFALTEFGIHHNSGDKGQMLMALNHWLLDRHRAGQTAVLIVDEAQNLSTRVLEEIRLLTNLETPTEKLLQIILAGQPELEDRLKQPELEQIRQRITIWCKTRPLSILETYQYMARRIEIAGGDIHELFTLESIANAYRFTHGIPRVINVLCEHALIASFAEHEKPVTAETVASGARQLDLEANALPFRMVPLELVEGSEQGVSAVIVSAEADISPVGSLTGHGEPCPRLADTADLSAPKVGPGSLPVEVPAQGTEGTQESVGVSPGETASARLAKSPLAGGTRPASDAVILTSQGDGETEGGDRRSTRALSMHVIHPTRQQAKQVFPLIWVLIVLLLIGVILLGTYYLFLWKSGRIGHSRTAFQASSYSIPFQVQRGALLVALFGLSPAGGAQVFR